MDSNSVIELNVKDAQKSCATKVKAMYAPMEGTMNPTASRIFQFLTFTANFNVTTIMTLVYADISMR